MSPFLAEAVVEGPLWAQIVYAVITALVAAFLLPYLNSKRQAVAAEIKTTMLEGISNEVTARSTLLSEVKIFLLERAACIAEKDFPFIAKEVLSGKMTVDRVKQCLRGLGQTLKVEALAYFKEKGGWDLIKVIGDKQLDNMIEYVANKVSPFPGKDSAVEFMKENVSNWIVNKGVDAVRKH